MIDIEFYLTSAVDGLKSCFGERLLYVGLQGSYLRGEATEESDIDLMVVIDRLSADDLDSYRGVIEGLGHYDQSCGFICSKEDLACWNRLELCHLLHSTRDCWGELASLLPAFTKADTAEFVKLSLNNLYHEICHRRIHADRAKNIAKLPQSFKGTFFILQNLHYLESGSFCATKAELLSELSGEDRDILACAMQLKQGGDYDYDAAYNLLFTWCQHALHRISLLSMTE